MLILGPLGFPKIVVEQLDADEETDRPRQALTWDEVQRRGRHPLMGGTRPIQDRPADPNRVTEPARARSTPRDASEVQDGGRVTFPATVTSYVRENP